MARSAHIILAQPVYGSYPVSEHSTIHILAHSIIITMTAVAATLSGAIRDTVSSEVKTVAYVVQSMCATCHRTRLTQ